MAKHVELPLAPCPFCAGQYLHLQHRLLSYTVVCQTCHSQGPHRHLLDQAVASWNLVSQQLTEKNKQATEKGVCY